MKKYLTLCLCTITPIFADIFVLDNQTKYPQSASPIRIQWAASSREMSEKNIENMYQVNVDQGTLQPVEKGINQVQAPEDQLYFRILVWTDEKNCPKYVSSWVPIVAKKTYTLKNTDLYPAVLTSGSGC